MMVVQMMSTTLAATAMYVCCCWQPLKEKNDDGDESDNRDKQHGVPLIVLKNRRQHFGAQHCTHHASQCCT
jgi:hypothetical protein